MQPKISFYYRKKTRRNGKCKVVPRIIVKGIGNNNRDEIKKIWKNSRWKNIKHYEYPVPITFSFTWKKRAKEIRFSYGTAAKGRDTIRILLKIFFSLSRCLLFLVFDIERKWNSKMFVDESIDKSFFMKFKLHSKSITKSFDVCLSANGLKRYRNWSRKWQSKLHHLFKAARRHLG